MRLKLLASILLSVCAFGFEGAGKVVFSGEKKLNNLVVELLEVSSISKASSSFGFARLSEGWVFVSFGRAKGKKGGGSE